MRNNPQSAVVGAARLQRAGFTLIEVIVSLALFALAATVLASAYINVLDATERVKGDQAFEQDIALVREQVLIEPDRKTVEEGGDLPTAGEGDASWQATITPSEVVADLFRVDFEVTFNQPGQEPAERKVTQTLWLLRPDWSEPTDRDALRAETRKRLTEIKQGRSL